MQKALVLVIALFYCITIAAQHLDVEGDARIEGKLNIISATGDSSLFIGSNAGLSDDGTSNQNSFVGQNAGKSNTSGSFNSFFGKNAGFSNTIGSNNVYLGQSAGFSSTGSSNVYLGAEAGFSCTGSFNAFIGRSAGRDNTTGSWNVFLGKDAGRTNTTGSLNAFLGEDAGAANTTGGSNVFLGHNAGGSNTTGGFNVLLGRSAGDSNDSGEHNTILGPFADLGSDDLNDAIAIGYYAKVDCSNCAVFGGSVAPVNLGLGTSNPADHKLHVTSDQFTGAFIKGSEVAIELGGTNSSFGHGTDDAVIRTQIGQDDGDMFLVSNDFISLHLNDDNNVDDSEFEIRNGADVVVTSVNESGNMVIAGNLTENSDRNLKQELSPLTGVLPRLLSLAGYSYFLKDHLEQGPQIGLIAQEVEAKFPELVHTSDQDIKSVNYTRFVPLLIEGLKAQAEEIRKMQLKYDKQNAQIVNLRKKMAEVVAP